ncbi:hypothetical protein CFSAN002369_02375, partial [Clostridium botulinum CFSAN002369]
MAKAKFERSKPHVN